MIIDAQATFSSAQAVTAAAASTNYMDLQAIGDLGMGEPIWLIVACVVAMTDSGSDSTLAVTIETDDNTSFSSATSVATVGTFAATSAAGTRLAPYRIAAEAVVERYMRLYYTPANGNLSTGSFDAFLTKDIDKFTAYAKGYTIS